eukprot:maker-scaffold_18-snap-gene-5.1-mRNA-1 protein AED:0.03 eAED:0.03 QI:76/1/1/1/1/1/4/121/245
MSNNDGLQRYLRMQPYIFGYGFGISIFSPTASLYQLAKLNPQVKLSPSGGVKLAMRILPHQTCLKALQMNASTPVKESLNPWAAFFVVGVLQGGVYGHANIFFSKTLKIGKKLSYAGMLRGVGFAGVRDTFSQGIPYVFSKTVEEKLFSPVFSKVSENKSDALLGVQRWTAVLSTSVFATYVSQCFHNCQITMQTDQTLTHLTAARAAFKQNGFSILYKGGEARVGLLLVVNVLNELLLKKAWEQ